MKTLFISGYTADIIKKRDSEGRVKFYFKAHLACRYFKENKCAGQIINISSEAARP